MDIAIIGMGGAGISVLREWAKKKKENPSLNITVFGDAKTFGTGLPYQAEDTSILLNQPAEWTTIVPENKLDFVEWLQEKKINENPLGAYVPRAFLGQYLTERMTQWIQEAKAEVIQKKVEELHRLPNGQFELLYDGKKKTADVVHLCIGHLPFKTPYHLEGHPHVIDQPFPLEQQLTDIPAYAKVGVLGTGLTAIDILRYVHTNRPDLSLSFYSRSGEFKSIRAEHPAPLSLLTGVQLPPPLPMDPGLFISLKTYEAWMEQQAETMGFSLRKVWKESSKGTMDTLVKEWEHPDELRKLHLLMHKMEPYLSQMWLALTEEDKTRFIRKYVKTWDRLRSPFPYESGRLLIDLWREKKIAIFSGLQDIQKRDGQFRLLMDDDAPQEVEYLINAMGAERKITTTNPSNSLIGHMLNEYVIQPERWGGVQVLWPSLSAVSKKYGVMHNLKIHGQIVSGVEFANNSLAVVSQSAKTAVDDLDYYWKNKKGMQQTE